MKICRDCLHIKPLARCGRFDIVKVNLVSGMLESAGPYKRCDTERKSNKITACGPEGRFFLKRSDPPPPTGGSSIR